MKYEIENNGTTTVLTLKSERIDSSNAAELKSQFIVLSNTDNENLVLDMSNVTMADSSGISALLMAFRIYRDSNRTMSMCCVQTPVRKLLEITQLDKVFHMFSSLEDALASIEKTSAATESED